MISFILLSCGAIILLLMVSAFFSGSETALTAASRPWLHAEAQNGNQRAILVDRLRHDQERLIGCLLLGNNLVNILATALASNMLIQLFNEAGVAVATLVMTLLVVILAEILPKTYALRAPEQTALAVAPIVRLIVGLLAPISLAIQAVVRLAFGLFRTPFTQAIADPTDTTTELRGAIDLHTVEKSDIRHERAMLRSILDIADLTIGDIMTHRSNMVTIDMKNPPDQILSIVRDSPFTRIPVWQDDPDNVLGVLHTKNLFRALSDAGGDIRKVDLLTVAAEPWFVPETANLPDQLRAFQKRREHFSLVVDEYGSLMGVVTLEDILEEIVGEIGDEHDVHVQGIEILPKGEIIADGTVGIRDLNREFEWRLPDDEASTIAGLVLHEARLIPDTGQCFVFYGFQFEILERQRNQITKLRLTPMAPEARNILSAREQQLTKD